MQNTFSVRYSDNMDFNEALIHQCMVKEGYMYPIAEQRFDSKSLDKFLIELDHYNMKEYNFNTDDNFFKTYKCDAFWLDITKSSDRKNAYVDFNCSDIDTAADIFKVLSKYNSTSSEMEVYCTTYSMNNGLYTNFKAYAMEDYVDTNELYYPYIDTNVMFEQFYGNKENILILCGAPGTGKTSLTRQLLKYSINNPSKIPYSKVANVQSGDFEFLKVAYVKSTEVLATDNWWSTISSEEYDLVILDDLDYFLTSREASIESQEDVNRNKFINHFLSFTDGIEKNRTKFIITTNQAFDDIDEALMRKGRLFDILELKALTNDEAKAVWKSEGLKIKDFDFRGPVLQSDLGSEIYKRNVSKAVIKPYLTDASISRLVKTNKKLGF